MRKITIILPDEKATALYPTLSGLGANFNSEVWNDTPIKTDWTAAQKTWTGLDKDSAKKRKKFHHPSGKTQHVLMFERFAGQKNVSYNMIKTWMNDEGMTPSGFSATVAKLISTDAAQRDKINGHRGKSVTFMPKTAEIVAKVLALISGGERKS